MPSSFDATPGYATTAHQFAVTWLASLLAIQSEKRLAWSIFLLVFMMLVASISQPRPSFGKIRSTGAPDFLTWCARNSKEMPIGNSPAPACLQGLEPEWTYWATFWCSASMYFQPSVSPMFCSQDDTSR